MKSIIFYVRDGFADWEASFILPILRQNNIKIHVASDDARVVYSAGGLRIGPDGALDNFLHFETDGLILPGGHFWSKISSRELIYDLIAKLDQEGKMVAAICAATIALARKGLLDNRHHTSNDLQFLKAEAPDYQGERLYHDKKLAVGDGNLITASGVGAIEFTEKILEHLKIYSPQKREQWYQLFKKGVKPPQEFFS